MPFYEGAASEEREAVLRNAYAGGMSRALGTGAQGVYFLCVSGVV